VALLGSLRSLRLPDAIVLATAHVLAGELLTYNEKLERGLLDVNDVRQPR
jgi:predicted nucleic acid-binding protein